MAISCEDPGPHAPRSQPNAAAPRGRRGPALGKNKMDEGAARSSELGAHRSCGGTEGPRGAGAGDGARAVGGAVGGGEGLRRGP